VSYTTDSWPDSHIHEWCLQPHTVGLHVNDKQSAAEPGNSSFYILIMHGINKMYKEINALINRASKSSVLS